MVVSSPLLDTRRVHLNQQLSEAIVRAEDACLRADLLQQRSLKMLRDLGVEFPVVAVSVQNKRVTVQVR